jgi:hypothetical protein
MFTANNSPSGSVPGLWEEAEAAISIAGHLNSYKNVYQKKKMFNLVKHIKIHHSKNLKELKIAKQQNKLCN